ncbi:HutD family protein [Rouxiella sp. Mn2063]|uniref:HutD/Ves family protein n=1 Tax=Rouxiella sp. Mn2063 TaxID=3395262 RepID=UPI003BBBE2BD
MSIERNAFHFDTLPVSPWRNGGGETREIFSFPVGATAFDWRASIATIAQDGPFSAFPGIDRSITLLSGAGVHLFATGESSGEVDHLLSSPGEPFAFSGDTALDSRLLADVTTDFNIMTRRGVCHSSVVAKRQSFALNTGLGGVLYVLSGQWLLNGKPLAEPRGGVWWNSVSAADEQWQISHEQGDGLLLWAAILPG